MISGDAGSVEGGVLPGSRDKHRSESLLRGLLKRQGAALVTARSRVTHQLTLARLRVHLATTCKLKSLKLPFIIWMRVQEMIQKKIFCLIYKVDSVKFSEFSTLVNMDTIASILY